MLPFVIWSCGPSNTNETTEDLEEASVEPSLTLLWETPEELITNESVLFDENSGVIYVANIEGNPTEDKFVALVLANTPTQVTLVPDALGQVRTLPGMLSEAGGLDGFFMARLRHRH